ncbi:hypothetical protein PR202_ga22854 [Eleusine coracana subsp. coracana]|uniref:DUF4216 domain-containing protein n=1 Tax=Eleusine coracana subsp. coracana TaxID=191504 RepID=A0AAV5D4N5_ELECO|nr:hypothetical protein PR202_ga22854 [Eleusine coracana subsp. coracana]
MVVKCQNSGIFVKGDDDSGNKDYFSVLTDIVKLTYSNYSVVLFKCDWWDAHSKGRGVKTDRYGFTLVNTGRTSRANDPYILATQAEQVYHVKDTRDAKWLVVVKTKPRDLYDVPPDEEQSDIAIMDKCSNEACQENEYITVASTEAVSVDNDSVILKRQDVCGQTVAANPKKQSDNEHHEADDEEDEDSESDGLEYIDSDNSSDNENKDDEDDS